MRHGKKGNFWLDDDIEWENLRSRVNDQTKSPTTFYKEPTNLQIPKNFVNDTDNLTPKKIEFSLQLKVPNYKFPKIPRKNVITGIIITTIIVSIVAGFKILPSIFRNNEPEPEPVGVLGQTVKEPKFSAVLPNGKKEDANNEEIRYDSAKNVVNYTDKIDNVDVTVSQQPLPANFEANPDEEVKKMAESFSANDVINESNPKAYLGNDVKGPQTVIFHKKGLLIFILSTRKIEKASWAEYITKLQ